MRDLIRAADCILFDFDGPVCALFAGHPAAHIARNLRALISEHGGPADLVRRLESTADPQVVLRAVDPGSRLSGILEQALTEEELVAAKSSVPTPDADRLVRELVAAGRRVAVTTNNAAAAVERYLAGRGLLSPFSGHIHGRLGDARLLKPHPDCLERALASTRTPPGKALMIGDTVHDLHAARGAGVAFLGYSPRKGRRDELLAAGADEATPALRDVITALRRHPEG